MHRIGSFNINECCNEFVSKDILRIVNQLRTEYVLIDDKDVEKKKDVYLNLLYNLPSGLIITAGMSTNYRCMQNIYQQRNTHRLPDWKEFCEEIKTFPMVNELITRGK